MKKKKDALIADILKDENTEFLEFCSAISKKYRSELTDQDYNSFRLSCSVGQKEAKRIKKLIDSYDASLSPVNKSALQSGAEGKKAKDGSLFLQQGGKDEFASYVDSSGTRLPDNKICLRRYVSQIMGGEAGKKGSKIIVPIIDELSYEADIPLCKLFKVNPQVYDKVLLRPENIGVRAYNGLRLGKKKKGKAAPVKTVGALLCLSSLEILNYRHMGTLSLMHIITVLPAVLHSVKVDSKAAKNRPALSEQCKRQLINLLSGRKYDAALFNEKEKAVFEKYVKAHEVIGAELALAAVKKSPSIKPITQMLYGFYEKHLRLYDRQVQLKKAAYALSDKIKGLKFEPFLLSYRISFANDKNLPRLELEPETTIFEFARSVLNNKRETGKTLDFAISFFNWLNFDVKALCKPIRDCFERQSKVMKYILTERIAGKTLNGIGDIIGVTRERVRQIEKESAKKLAYLYGLQKEYHDIISVIYALHGGEQILFYKDIAQELDEKETKLIWYLASKGFLDCDFYHYSASSNAIIFGDALEPSVLNDLISKLPPFFDKREMHVYSQEFINDYGVSEKMANQYLNDAYKLTGSIYHHERFTKTSLCEYILRTKFPKGFKIADKADYERFAYHCRAFFAKGTVITNRALDAKISQIGILSDRGKYIHPAYVNADKKVVAEINDHIKNSQRVLLSYNELFKTFAARLKTIGIKNRYALHGMLKMAGCPFIMRKDYITKEPELNLAAEFERFVERRGRVHKTEILKEFNGLSEINISLFCQRLTSVVVLGDGWYAYYTQFNITKQDYAEQRRFLLDTCGEMPVSTRALFNKYAVKFAEFAARNNLKSQADLFGILKFMFRNEFYFSRPYVSVNSKEDLTHHSVLLRRLVGVDTIEIEKLLKICKDNGIHFVSVRALIKSLEPDYVRINKTTLTKKEFVGIDDSVISYVVQVIKAKVKAHNGICAAKNITDFKKFPPVDVPWNTYLLEAVASLADDVLTILHISTSTIYAPADVYIGGVYADEDLPSLIVRVLVEQHTKAPFRSREALYKWLRQLGLCNVRLPAFLEANGYVDHDENGKLVVRDVKKDKRKEK